MGIFSFLKRKNKEEFSPVEDNSFSQPEDSFSSHQDFNAKDNFRQNFTQDQQFPQFPQPAFSQPNSTDIQLISAKLDLINQRLEILDRRLQVIEQIAKENQ